MSCKPPCSNRRRRSCHTTGPRRSHPSSCTCHRRSEDRHHTQRSRSPGQARCARERSYRRRARPANSARSMCRVVRPRHRFAHVWQRLRSTHNGGNYVDSNCCRTTWLDDSSEDRYGLAVFDSYGTVVWESETPKSVVTLPYGGPALACTTSSASRRSKIHRRSSRAPRISKASFSFRDSPPRGGDMRLLHADTVRAYVVSRRRSRADAVGLYLDTSASIRSHSRSSAAWTSLRIESR